MKRSLITLLTVSLFLLASVPGFADDAAIFFDFVVPDTTPTGVIAAGSDIQVDIYSHNNAAQTSAVSIAFRFSGTGDITTLTYRAVGANDATEGRTNTALGLNSFTILEGWNTTVWNLGVDDFFGFSADGALPDTFNYTGSGFPGWNTTADLTHYLSIFLGLPAGAEGTLCIDSVTNIPNVVPANKYDWLFEYPAYFMDTLVTQPERASYCWTVQIQNDVEEIESDLIPDNFELGQNYPNPFNPNTNIKFAVPQKSHVNISIFNILGQKIRNLVDSDYGPGYYVTDWDGTSSNGAAVASGIYFYKIEADNFKDTKKLMLLR